jgi:hypothetical protein
MYGAKDMDHMNLHELQALESNLEIWVHNIRSTKVSFMSFSAQTQKIQKWLLLIYCPFSAKQMEIVSREIEMLKNKVGYRKNYSSNEFFKLTCRKVNTAIPFISSFSCLCLCSAGRHTEGYQRFTSRKGILIF